MSAMRACKTWLTKEARGTSVVEGAGSGTAKAVQGGPRPSKQAQGGPGRSGPFGPAAGRSAAEARATVEGPAQGEDQTCE